jgi:hypothetical protein
MRRQTQAAQMHISVNHLDDFEERIFADDLGTLLADIQTDRTISEELIYGVESLKYFRAFYRERQRTLSASEHAQLEAYDHAWCLELLDLVQRERGDGYFRA